MDVRAATQAKPSLSVLVVDDNEVNQLYMQHLLRKMGHAPVMAGDGHQALAAMNTQPFDLILMDVQLPDMDGLTLARTIRDGRASPVNRTDIPILAVTAYSSNEDRALCLAAGMNAHLSKPLRAEDLRAAMAQWVPALSSSPQEDKSPLRHPPFDLIAFTNENRPAFAQKMLSLFLEMAPRKDLVLQRALADGDLETAMAAAHDLAGMAGPLQASRLHETMKAVQEACQAGKRDTAQADYARAGRELATVLGVVRAHPYIASPDF